MNAGEVEQMGVAAEIYRRPASRFVATFIGSPPMNIVEGRVEGCGRVDVAGHGLAVADLAPGIAAGTPVDVGLRPEDLRVVDGAGLAVAVDFVEELGATRLFHGTVGDAAVVVALSGPAPVGASFGLSAAPEAVHLFDPATGNSLRRPPAA
jgi:sn-glycerol 3-phosphate transport system ATP-binding protein